MISRAGQIWLYSFQDGTTRVVLVTDSESEHRGVVHHDCLTLDLALNSARVGTTERLTEGTLIRHWERIA